MKASRLNGLAQYSIVFGCVMMFTVIYMIAMDSAAAIFQLRALLSGDPRYVGGAIGFLIGASMWFVIPALWTLYRSRKNGYLSAKSAIICPVVTATVLNFLLFGTLIGEVIFVLSLWSIALSVALMLLIGYRFGKVDYSNMGVKKVNDANTFIEVIDENGVIHTAPIEEIK